MLKKHLIMLLGLILSLVFVFISCNDDESSSTQIPASSLLSEQSSTSDETSIEPSNESSTNDSTSTESSTQDSTDTSIDTSFDSSTDTSTDISTDTSTSEESSTIPTPPPEDENCTIIFDVNGGKCDVSTLEVKKGSSTILPTPTHEKLFFRGWYSNGEMVTNDTIFNDDTTLVAQYFEFVSNINYLRISDISKNTVTIKFNNYGEIASYDIRYSNDVITEDNFDSATKADATISGSDEISAVLNLSASIDDCYYIAVKPYINTVYGNMLTVRAGGNKLIPIKYSGTTVYHGETIESLSALFDEQDEKYGKGKLAPKTILPQIYTNSSDKILYGTNISPIIDLEYIHYISSVNLYYGANVYDVVVRWSKKPVDFMADNSKWDGYCSLKSADMSTRSWAEIPINSDTRYIQIIFKDGNAPTEVFIYGYQSGEGDGISSTRPDLPSMNELMGMCGFTANGGGNTPIESIKCTNVLREYHQFLWSYKPDLYPNKASFFTNIYFMGNFDKKYAEYTNAGILVIPCVQWGSDNMSFKVDSSNLPIKSNGSFVESDFWGKFNPHTYFKYADSMFAYAARYGSNKSSKLLEIAKNHTSDSNYLVGSGHIKWMELGNEPDGEWYRVHKYLSPYQLAALTSAGYDGHCKTMVSTVSDKGYHLGIKNADPDMKVAMAGLAGIKPDYIAAMCYWMRANRQDESVAIDAFNLHQYFTEKITLNNQSIEVGVSPENYDIVDRLSEIIEFRNKYYPEIEVWLTEFGWDTSQSYETITSAHAYGEYTGRQVQAMWLTRTYLVLSACGVDKAMMYMCEDTNVVDTEAVGKFKTCGVIGFEYNDKGEKVEFKKDSYYYLYTLKNALGDYTFFRELNSKNPDVWIYEYKTDDQKTAYAIWCPTSDGTCVEGYRLPINSASATLIESVYGDIDGVRTTLTSTDGYITINISENPIYILVD